MKELKLQILLIPFFMDWKLNRDKMTSKYDCLDCVYTCTIEVCSSIPKPIICPIYPDKKPNWRLQKG